MKSGIFRFDREDDVLIITPTADLRELEFDLLEEGAEDVMRALEERDVKHVVIDFQLTDYYGSTALSFFVKLWKRVKCCGGKMILCGVSSHEKEILEITHLDDLWPIVADRDDALAQIANEYSV